MTAALRLRVVTFNIHGGRPEAGPPDLAAIAGVLRDLNADLIALQEVHRYLPPPGIFQDQPRRLHRLLGMEVTFRRSFGTGRVGYGNAVLSHVAPHSVRLIRLPSVRESRALLEADLLFDSRPLRFLNTHLGLTHEERLAQADEVARHIQASQEPVILAGDLNAAPASTELETIARAGLLSCGPPDLLTFPAGAPQRRLDYVLTSPHFQVEQAFVVPTLVSDHLPLVANLILCRDP